MDGSNTSTVLRVMVFLVLNALLLSNGYADGPPIRNGRISAPHQTIKLAETQIASAGSLRFIELNREQIDQLNKASGRQVATVLYLITDPYYSCSCGLGFYGLWVSRDKVQIPNRSLGYTDGKFGHEGIKIKNLKDARKFYVYNTLCIDYEGRVYQKGVRVDEYRSVCDQVMPKGKKLDDADKYIWVETPPKCDRIVIKNVFRKIRAYFEPLGFEVNAYFEKTL